MQMTNQEYARYVKSIAPKSRTLRDTIMAFVSGGFICVIGQALAKLYAYWGAEPKLAAASASITLVAIAAILTAFGVYDNLAKWAGGGLLVPITGFSNAMVSPAMEFKSEGFVAGMASKMFTIAGPVLIFGVLASVLYGLVLLLTG